jgi:uncharacterized membrane protein YdbT with pleckstrin-like domain
MGQTMARPRLTARRHAIVLAWPLARALLLAAVGLALVVHGWPVSPAGALALAISAAVALAAVWRWERTRVALDGERLVVVHGGLRRRTASAHARALEIEQTLLGRVLGYGTVIAGDLEVPYVARPHELARLGR